MILKNSLKSGFKIFGNCCVRNREAYEQDTKSNEKYIFRPEIFWVRYRNAVRII